MIVYRLSREKYKYKLSGIGAALFGARWNSKGTEIIYTAESRALAMAEVAVHLTMATLPDDYYMLSIEIPGAAKMQKVKLESIPSYWNQFPYRNVVQNVGDQFVRSNKTLILQVPSAVVQGDHNILINPYHPDFKQVKIIEEQQFPFDTRLFE